MDKIAKMALLADFYGPLLTEKQQNVWDLYYEQDFSLAEIAESEHISRQAIYDLLKRTERILTEYEEKLGLVERFWTERRKLLEVKDLLQGLAEQDFVSSSAWLCQQKIRAMIEDIFVNISSV